MVPYAYWPWEKDYPKFRKTRCARKKAVLISSCAAPGVLGRLLYGTHKQLKTTAQVIGADTVGTLFSGLVAKDSHQRITPQVQERARARRQSWFEVCLLPVLFTDDKREEIRMADIDKVVAELKQKRDELALQIHLGSKEAQEEWAALEKRWEKFSADARLGESADEIGAAASTLGDELKTAYERIKKAMR